MIFIMLFIAGTHKMTPLDLILSFWTKDGIRALLGSFEICLPEKIWLCCLESDHFALGDFV